MKTIIKILIISNLILSISCANRRAINQHIKDKSLLKKVELAVNDENISKKYTIILGYLEEQTYVPNILPSKCFEENIICLDVFFLNKIKIKEVISGDLISGEILAARQQHGELYFRGTDLSIFVLEKITNENTSKLLKTNYMLEELIKPEVNYCINKDLKEQLSVLNEYIENCINQKYMAGSIKENEIQRISDEVEKRLAEDKILIKTDYEYSDGEIIIYEEDEDEVLDECLDEKDLDVIENNPKCGLDNLTHDVILYFLKKGTAESTKQLIMDLVNQSDLNLKDVQMNFISKEKTDMSILEWHYRVNHIIK
jgi:hypothetical protein